MKKYTVDSARITLIYTMTSGLGDYLIMGDVMRKIEAKIPGARCVMVHRDNPHITLWKEKDEEKRFFNIYSPADIYGLVAMCRKRRKAQELVLGMQLAPGSIQGYMMHKLLKLLGAEDYIVDLNLINADIITPARSNYIFDIHLDQIEDILKVRFTGVERSFVLPVSFNKNSIPAKNKKIQIGVHPWSRRGNCKCFVWGYEKWAETIKFMIEYSENVEVIVLGRDTNFAEFQKTVEKLVPDTSRIVYRYAESVKDLVETVDQLDMLVTVNTSVVHMGYALGKKMVVLIGPSLDLWTPKGAGIVNVRDKAAVFSGSDKENSDERFPRVDRIDPADVCVPIRTLLEGR